MTGPIPNQHQHSRPRRAAAWRLMAAAALLQSNPNPSDDDINAEMTNICRCGTYNRIRAAIKLAAAGGGDVGRG